MKPKKIAESRVTLSHMMGPQDANSMGNVHGGIIMKLADEAAGIAAMRHAQRPVVTVVVDSMTFMHPIHVGNFVEFRAELTYVGTTSMEVRVEVHREKPVTGERILSNTAYFVYVALDEEGRPISVPPLVFETEDERRRAGFAQERQAYRKQQRANEEQITHGK